MLDSRLPLVVVCRNAKGSRDIPARKWWVHRDTPVGEDADIYERKPYGGNKYHPYTKILGNRAEDGTIINAPRR